LSIYGSSQGSASVTLAEAVGWNVWPNHGRAYISSPKKCPDLLWDPSSPIFSRYQRLEFFPGDKGAGVCS